MKLLHLGARRDQSSRWMGVRWHLSETLGSVYNVRSPKYLCPRHLLAQPVVILHSLECSSQVCIRELAKTQTAGLSDSVDLGWGPRTDISNKFPGNTADPGTGF